MPVRILIHFRTRGTGAEGVHLSGMAGGFTHHGTEVEFSSPTGVDPRTARGSNPFGQKQESLLGRLSRRCPKFVFELLEIAYNAAAWWRNRRLLRKGQFTFIYERHAFFLCATAGLAKRFNLPLVIEVNELVGDERIRPNPTFLRLAQWADRQVFCRASLVVTVSPHLARRVVEAGADPQKVLVLPNAVSAATLDRAETGPALRQKLGIASTDIVIGFVGWFVPWHRLDLLLEAAARLAALGHSVRLLLVGAGPLESELQALAERHGFAASMIWAGAVPHDSVAEYVGAFDIAVVPHCNDYRSPIKLFEYMAARRAVVAPSVEPIATVVDAECAALFTPGDVDSLFQSLERLVQSPQLRTEFGQRGWELVRSRHTWEHNARRVLDALKISPVTVAPSENPA